MSELTFAELFSARDVPAEEVVDRYTEQTALRFNHETGVPVVVCAASQDDVPLLLAALGRSTIELSPMIVNNIPGKDRLTSLALRMGARVTEESTPGQMKALQTGLQIVSGFYPEAPILVTDDDSLPVKTWAETMLRRTRLSREIGGIAHGTVIIEHGPSFATDVLRTGYAASVDIQRRLRGATPKARGYNTLLQLDDRKQILSEIKQQPANAFPSDLRVLESVLAAGGVAHSVLDPRAVVCTRGDRFKNVGMLFQDLRERSANRIDLYDIPKEEV